MRRALTWQLILGAAIIGGWIVLGLAAPLLTDVDPLKSTTLIIDGPRSVLAPYDPGTYGYPLGSDRSGRDLWTGVMYGARATLTIAFVVLAVRLLVGTTLGALAGWFAGSSLDRAVSALIDAFGAFPTVLFAMLWIFAFDIRSGITAFAAALAITGWWGFGRATRSAVVALRGRPFLEAARSLGLSEFAVFARHVLPNLLPMLAVAAALEASAILLVLGELGFLGIVVGGGQNVSGDVTGRGGGTEFIFATTEWGAILAQGRFEIYRAQWIALVPATAFASAILGFNLFGHGLRSFFERAPVALGKLLSLRTAFAVVAIFVAFRLASPYVGPAGSYVAVAREFDAGRARAHVDWLADTARAGRYTGSAGYDESARYVADQFKSIGLEALGNDGTYFQNWGTNIVKLTAMPVLERVGDDEKRYQPRADFSERVGGRAGGGTAEGNVVYVGGGIRTPEYSDYQGTHPEGNIVMIAGPTQGDPIDAAIRSGAKAVIFVAAPERGLIRPSYIAFFEKDTLPVITVSEAVADELIAPSGKHIADLRNTLEERRRRSEQRPSLVRSVPEPLSFDTPTRIRIEVSLAPPEPVRTMNVVGMLRGSDPDRAKKFVIVGGHLDGVGTDPDGTVYPAANDNASGPAVTIEIARVLAAKKALLKNSVIFVAFAGEEEGLIGSEAFIQNAVTTPYRADNIVAYINLDMEGCCGGLAASDENFALHQRLKSAADRLGYDLEYPSGSGGSDHLTFLRRRVPAVVITGTDVGSFHTAGDAPSTVDPARLRASGEVVLQSVLEMAASG
ncbi:MAG TPA: M28 family peptidase [Candidatus Limnocylindria bacterium]|jgi:peptide/nickel transport system permease protein|nr:M28 family peptidase [Candidatus Limnocylindria bacterium]